MATPLATPSKQNRVRANGIELAVTSYAGTGPPLLLIHGIGSRGVSWWPVIDALAGFSSPHVLDLRGHGDSDKPPSGYLLPDYARDISGVIAALGLARPWLMGHSLGGLATLHWALENPATAAAIVLEDVPLRGGPERLPAFDGWLALNALPVAAAAAHFANEHPGWTAEDCYRRAESITATAREVFIELRAANAQEPAVRIESLATITSPALLLHGDIESGGMLTASEAARFAAIVPNSKVVRVPNGGHALHRDHSDSFVREVRAFLLDQRVGEGAA